MKRLFDSKLISIRIFDQKFGGKKMIGQFQASLPRFLANFELLMDRVWKL